MNLSPRQSEAFELRSRGLSYYQIGKAMGITPGAARAHVIAAEYRKAAEPLVADAGLDDASLVNLTTRIKSILWNNSIPETKEAALDAVLTGKLAPGKTRNYGVGTHSLLCRWVGLQQPSKMHHLSIQLSKDETRRWLIPQHKLRVVANAIDRVCKSNVV